MSKIQRLAYEGREDIRKKVLHNWAIRQKIDRPSWDTYLMNIARAASLRSPDAQTKVGCVIVNSQNQVLGMGYNGGVSGIDDSYIPNVRPAKYKFMPIHAELNAVCNCTTKPIGAKVYVNMRPCTHCLQVMAQFGISEIIYEDVKPFMCQDPEEEINFEIIKALLENKLKLRVYHG